MFQVQWLTGRKADYWHQDVRWKTHWDQVLFLYVGDPPTPTDIACPDTAPHRNTTPKEYVKHPQGQPDIAARTNNGDLTIYRPDLKTGGKREQLFFCTTSFLISSPLLRHRPHRQPKSMAPYLARPRNLRQPTSRRRPHDHQSQVLPTSQPTNNKRQQRQKTNKLTNTIIA